MKNVNIHNQSSTPIYQQLYDQISTQIYNGDLEKDSMLPSIRKTAKELRVSIITIKKTWEMLEANGLIYTVPGKGSYIQKNTEDDLNKMKIDHARSLLTESVEQVKQLEISKEEVIKLIEEIYKK